MATKTISPAATTDGAGTVASPYQLSQVIDANVDNGDTLAFLNETPASPVHFDLSDTTGLTIKTADGETGTYVHDAMSRISSGWSQEAGPNDSVYSHALTGASVLLCIEGWGEAADGSHRRQGTMTIAASVAACQAAPGSFYFASNVLYIHPLGSVAPTETYHAYITASAALLKLDNCTDVIIENFGVAGVLIAGDDGIHITGTAAEIGTPVLSGIVAYDFLSTGADAILIDPTSGALEGLRLNGFNAYGGNCTISIQTASDADIDNVQILNANWAFAGGLLDAAGDISGTATASIASSSLKIEPNGSGVVTSSFMRFCSFFTDEPGHAATPFLVYKGAAATSQYDPKTYGFHYDKCTVVANAWTHNAAGSIAFHRCCMNFLGAAATAYAHPVWTVGNGTQAIQLWASSRFLFAEATSGANYEPVGIDDGQLMIINSYVHRADRAGGSNDRFFHGAGGGWGIPVELEIRGSVISQDSAGSIATSESNTFRFPTQFIFESNIYSVFNSAAVTELSGIETTAELESHDAGTPITNQVNQWAGATAPGGWRPRHGSDVATAAKLATAAWQQTRGFTNRVQDGAYGAAQSRQPIRRMRRALR